MANFRGTLVLQGSRYRPPSADISKSLTPAKRDKEKSRELAESERERPQERRGLEVCRSVSLCELPSRSGCGGRMVGVSWNLNPDHARRQSPRNQDLSMALHWQRQLRRALTRAMPSLLACATNTHTHMREQQMAAQCSTMLAQIYAKSGDFLPRMHAVLQVSSKYCGNHFCPSRV